MSDVRQVTILSCVPKQKADGTVIQGTNARGPWTMHQVMATTADGQPIQDQIISFAPLPLGEQMVTVSVKTDSYGRTLTFQPVNGTTPPARPSTPTDEGHEMLRQTIS